MSTRRRIAPRLGIIFALSFATPIGTAQAGIGDLLGTQPGDLSNPSSFADADGCDNCHGGGYMGDDTYLPSDAWAGTMMANAARDPVFFAALSVANQDLPGVGTFCLRCHSPIGFVRGHATPPDGSAFDDVDRQGIGCETCHRARQAPGGGHLIGNAQLYYDDALDKAGPYVACDPDAPAPGCANSNAHAVVADPSLGESAFCGQCHQVDNPERLLRDARGVETAFAFPLDTTYEEWERSVFAADGADARSCQDCHMIRKPGQWPNVKGFGGAKRTDPRTHGFAGGNLWGIEAVMAHDPERASSHARAFEVAKDATRSMLAGAVSVAIEGAPEVLEASREYPIVVRVENRTGHKFPTGYAEGRRAWIAVAMIDGAGAETIFAGAYDASTGEIAATPPTRVYRAVHGVWDGAAAVADDHLVLHDVVVSDTRIPPRGFTGSPTTLPVGDHDYGPDAGTYRSFDQASFTVRAPATLTGKITLEARVVYQSMTAHHVEALRDANVTDDRGEELAAIFEATGRAAPITIATAARTYDFTPPPMGAPSSSGAGGEVRGTAGIDPSEVVGGSCTLSTAPPRSGSALLAACAASIAAAGLRRRRGGRVG